MTEACMWVTHHVANDNPLEDLHLVKLRVKNEDGSESVRLRSIENYKRPYYVTKPMYRDHEDRRDWEYKDKLNEYNCTQAELSVHTARTIGYKAGKSYIKQAEVNRSPYLYGTDVSAASIIKHEYMVKAGEYKPNSTVGVVDYETNMLNRPNTEDKDIIMGSFTYRGHITLAVRQDFMGPIYDPAKHIKLKWHELYSKFLDELKEQIYLNKSTREADGIYNTIQEYISKYMPDEPDITVVICDTSYDVAYAVMSAAHKSSPDVVTFWNMDFDIKAMMQACDDHDKPYTDLFCHPDIPDRYKHFNYIEAPAMKRKANGDVVTVSYEDRWHKVMAPATFIYLDAMVFYRLNRLMAGKMSFSLDATLHREIGLGKLRINEVQDVDGAEWHVIMQMKHKASYCIYNIFDCLMVELLDAITGDIGIGLNSFLDVSQHYTANSSPRLLCDKQHFFLLETDRVIASTSDKMRTDIDNNCLGTRGWIVTLPSEYLEYTGRSIVNSIPDEHSRLSFFNADIDVASGYPTIGDVMNISNDTTLMEIFKIEYISEHVQRRMGINYTGCATNAVDISHTLYRTPRLKDLLQYF